MKKCNVPLTLQDEPKMPGRAPGLIAPLGDEEAKEAFFYHSSAKTWACAFFKICQVHPNLGL